jgi:IclR family transcriptional regulator, acetate operon repressor
MSRIKSARQSGFGVGISLLEFLIESRGPRGVSQIAAHLDLPVSSIHDMLKLMSELGFVEKKSSTRLYRASARVFELAHKMASHYGVNDRVAQALRRYSREHGLTVCFAALASDQTYIACASGSFGDTVTLGAAGPAYATAAGKCLLALLPETEWSSFAPGPASPRLTTHTNTDPERFFRELRLAREHGVAWNIRETAIDFVSIAAPLPEPDGTARYAVAFLYPYDDWPLLDREDAAQRVKALATKLASSLFPRASRRAAP